MLFSNNNLCQTNSGVGVVLVENAAKVGLELVSGLDLAAAMIMMTGVISSKRKPHQISRFSTYNSGQAGETPTNMHRTTEMTGIRYTGSSRAKHQPDGSASEDLYE